MKLTRHPRKWGLAARPTVSQTKLKKHLTLILLVIAAVSCGHGEISLTSEERRLGDETGVPATLLLAAKAWGTNLRQLEGLDAEGAARKAAGVTLDVVHRKSIDAVRALQQQAGSAHRVFVSDCGFGFGGDPDALSILTASDPIAPVEVMGTSGWNYNISPVMVLAKLKEWDEEYGLVVRGAGFDWAEAEFRRQPTDMHLFAQEVYEFCPDVVDQGSDTVEALAAEMKSSNVLYLWWD